MIIKKNPQDFKVTELADLVIAQQGEYSAFMLSKTDLSTEQVCQKIADKLGLSFERISWGGRKDRRAITTQIVSIKNGPKLNLSEHNWQLEFLGFMDRPMGPDLIKGNAFEILLRELTEQEKNTITQNLPEIETNGFINYFDDQRFGSFVPNQGFIAEKILKEQFNGALKIYLTRPEGKDSTQDLERKKLFFQHWKDWEKLKTLAATDWELFCFQTLEKDPKAFLPLLQKIPSQEMSLYFAAYQANLWNETLRLYLKNLNIPLLTTEGVCGQYLFPEKSLDLEAINLPLAASKMEFAAPIWQETYQKVLQNNGLRTSLFNLRTIRQAYFKAHPRIVEITPKNFQTNQENDTVFLKFSLPAGSYATMLIKRLLAIPVKNII